VVPWTIWESWQDNYGSMREMLTEHGVEVSVIFPEGTRFWPQSSDYDIWVEGDMHRASKGEPRRKPGGRRQGSIVPRGWTRQDLATFQATAGPELRAALPHEVRRRAQLALIGNTMMTDCGSSNSPDYAQPGDFWTGPLRHDIDGARVEMWANLNDKLMQMSRSASQWATQNLRFPKTPGNKVVWQGKVEPSSRSWRVTRALTL
jgi:hypothetical protein